MLTIKVNNKQLVMDPTTKLRFEIQSPLFESDAIPGSYICPFDLPVSGNDIFNNAEFIEINRIYKKYDCIIYLDDFPIYTGQLILNISNPLKYRCSVVLTGIDIDFPDKKLNEIDYGEDVNMGGHPHDSNVVTGFAKLANAMTGYNWVFPVIHCHNFYGESDDTADSPANADYGGVIVANGVNVGKFLNNWDALLQKFNINAIRNNGSNGLADNPFVLVPQFKLTYLVRMIFESLGYSVKGDFFTDAFIIKLLFLNYFALDEKVKRYFVTSEGSWQQMIITTGRIEFGWGTAGEQDDDNCFDSSSSEYTINSVGYINIDCIFQAALSLYSGVTIFIIDVIKTDGTNESNIYHDQSGYISHSFYNTFQIHTSFHATQADLGKRLFIKTTFYSGAFVIHNARLIITHASYQNLNQFKNKMHIADHMTSNTVGTVLNAIKKNFGLAIWLNAETKEIEISFLKDILNSYHFIDITNMIIKNSMEISSVDPPGYWLTQKSDSETNDISLFKCLGSYLKLTDLPTPDKLNVVAEVLMEGCYYIYKKNDTDYSLSWVRYGTSVREVKKGIKNDNSSTNIKVSVEIGVTTNVIMNDRLISDSNQLGTSEAFETGVNESDMQLLIWHGMINDKNGHQYPFASALKYDVLGNIISDTELRLDGNSGVFPNYLQSWYNFMDTAEPINLQMKLKSTDVISLLQLFKPQQNKASQQIRKIKYNGSLMLPKSFSFIVSLQGEFIEAQISGLKDGGVEL